MNAQRLSRRIMTREWVMAQKNVLKTLDCLTPSQRRDIKELLIKNKQDVSNNKL